MITNTFYSSLLKQHPTLPARVMRIRTPHGEVLTPAFMPVGTRAMLNYLTPADAYEGGSQIILGGNTYHMLCSPGMEVLEAVGGMHAFMGWQHTMLTDSGGFQVWSLSERGQLCTIKEEGATFKHPLTGKVIHLTPQVSIQAQKIIGADIIMAFDQCTPEAGGREGAVAALERTHRWLQLSTIEHEKSPYSRYGLRQALFGIIQGGSWQDLRERSATFVLQQTVEGVAIGGEVIGFDMAKTIEVINWIRPMLPPDKVRYTMGVGLTPQNLLTVIEQGIDLFDCVAPTRNARHGTLYHIELVQQGDWFVLRDPEQGQGRLLIKKSVYARDDRPVMAGCDCYTCRHFSRAYLHYLFKAKLTAYFHLASIHNVYTMHNLCASIRLFIINMTN